MILAILFSGLASCTKDNGTLPADPVHLTTQLYNSPQYGYSSPYKYFILSWKINYAQNLTGYIIEKSINNQAFVEIIRQSPLDTTFRETIYGNDTMIAYRVRSYNSSGLSRKYSNTTSFSNFDAPNMLAGKWRLQLLQLDSSDNKYPNGDSILDENLIIHSDNTYNDSVKLKSYNAQASYNSWMVQTNNLGNVITKSDTGTSIQYIFTKGNSINYTATSLTIYSNSSGINNFINIGYVATFQKQ